jgi:hypothetical protein
LEIQLRQAVSIRGQHPHVSGAVGEKRPRTNADERG